LLRLAEPMVISRGARRTKQLRLNRTIALQNGRFPNGA
jgi:hypothetical protein